MSELVVAVFQIGRSLEMVPCLADLCTPPPLPRFGLLAATYGEPAFHILGSLARSWGRREVGEIIRRTVSREEHVFTYSCVISTCNMRIIAVTISTAGL